MKTVFRQSDVILFPTAADPVGDGDRIAVPVVKQRIRADLIGREKSVIAAENDHREVSVGPCDDLLERVNGFLLGCGERGGHLMSALLFAVEFPLAGHVNLKTGNRLQEIPGRTGQMRLKKHDISSILIKSG